MATSTFTAQLTAFASQSKQRMESVAKKSIENLIIKINTPKGAGGNMPVDTGYLRQSGLVSFGGMPSGPIRGERRKKGEKGAIYSYDAQIIVLEIAKMSIDGPSLFYGWSAHYAKYQEAKNSFLATGVQSWPDIVAYECNQLQRSIGG